jgi:hypothetical protein|tara:strand:+ start:214 stop:408 length:195 start_codon:yes stop_codon:yes gene_type:complete
MKLVLVAIVAMSLTACGSMTPKDMLKGANTIRNIGKITSPGVTEELAVRFKDAVDPTRGGGFKK